MALNCCRLYIGATSGNQLPIILRQVVGRSAALRGYLSTGSQSCEVISTVCRSTCRPHCRASMTRPEPSDAMPPANISSGTGAPGDDPAKPLRHTMMPVVTKRGATEHQASQSWPRFARPRLEHEQVGSRGRGAKSCKPSRSRVPMFALGARCACVSLLAPSVICVPT